MGRASASPSRVVVDGAGAAWTLNGGGSGAAVDRAQGVGVVVAAQSAELWVVVGAPVDREDLIARWCRGSGLREQSDARRARPRIDVLVSRADGPGLLAETARSHSARQPWRPPSCGAS